MEDPGAFLVYIVRIDELPSDSLRRSIARNMTESWHVSPTVTYTHPVDCTALMALRLTLRESFEAEGLKISYNHILIKMAAQVLMEFPDVNASVRGDQLVRHIHANVGLAVTKGNGLIVPNEIGRAHV